MKVLVGLLMLCSPLLAIYTYATYETAQIFKFKVENTDVTLGYKKESETKFRMMLMLVVPKYVPPTNPNEMTIGCSILAFNVAKQTAEANAWDGADNLMIIHFGGNDFSFNDAALIDGSTKSTILTEPGKTYLGTTSTIPKGKTTKENLEWVAAKNLVNETSLMVKTEGDKTTMSVEFIRDFVASNGEGDGPYTLTKEIPFSIISNTRVCRIKAVDEFANEVYFTNPSEVYFGKIPAINPPVVTPTPPVTNSTTPSPVPNIMKLSFIQAVSFILALVSIYSSN